MTRSGLTDTWRSEVESQFSFLGGNGYIGPTLDAARGSIEYVSREFAITAHYGGRYEELSVEVASIGSKPDLKAELSELFVGAQLGPAQTIGHIGRSRHSIKKAVSSQADALRTLLPMLNDPRLNLLATYGRAVPIL